MIPNNFIMYGLNLAMLGGSLVTAAWHTLGLQMEEAASSYGE
jgi:hypothetical protein